MNKKTIDYYNRNTREFVDRTIGTFKIQDARPDYKNKPWINIIVTKK